MSRPEYLRNAFPCCCLLICFLLSHLRFCCCVARDVCRRYLLLPVWARSRESGDGGITTAMRRSWRMRFSPSSGRLTYLPKCEEALVFEESMNCHRLQSRKTNLIVNDAVPPNPRLRRGAMMVARRGGVGFSSKLTRYRDTNGRIAAHE